MSRIEGSEGPIEIPNPLFEESLDANDEKRYKILYSGYLSSNYFWKFY